MEKLYEITGKIIEYMDKVEELSEEESKAMEEELALALRDKSSNICGYVKNIEAYIEASKAEEKRLKENREIAENKLDKFKEYVKNNMERLGFSKIETPLGTLTLAKNPMSVEITNEEVIPKEFKKEVVTVKVDKTAIKDHFKETGELIDGVEIIDNKYSVRIK